MYVHTIFQPENLEAIAELLAFELLFTTCKYYTVDLQYNSKRLTTCTYLLYSQYLLQKTTKMN